MKPEAATLAARATTSADLEYIERLENDPQAARFVTVWTQSQHQAAIDSSDLHHVILEDSHSETRVGFVLFAGLDNPHRSIELRRIVIERPGRGHGRLALRWAKRWAFNERGAHRLWLDVKTFNAAARHLYASEGFVDEGILRECERGPDGYESLVLMSILEHEYREQEGR